MHDVLDTGAARGLFGDLVQELGGLDLFVYCSGMMQDIEPDEYDTEKDLAQLAVQPGRILIVHRAWAPGEDEADGPQLLELAQGYVKGEDT